MEPDQPRARKERTRKSQSLLRVRRDSNSAAQLILVKQFHARRNSIRNALSSIIGHQQAQIAFVGQECRFNQNLRPCCRACQREVLAVHAILVTLERLR
jgi:hypothetical protein